MKRLWAQLAVAFGLVAATAVLIVAIFAGQQVGGEFRTFVIQSQLRESGLVAQLTAYYETHGSWGGVESIVPGGGMGMGRGMMRGAPTILIADADGRVVAMRGTAQNTTVTLSSAEQASAIPIIVNGATVGYVVAQAPGTSEMPMYAQAQLSQINRSLLLAGLLAASLGVVLGLVLARRVSAPLARLSSAARQIAGGDLTGRVPEEGAAEITMLAHSFNAMAAALQQAEQTRRSMTADVAHELRTPLSVIQGNLRALLDGVYPLEKAEIATIYDETLVLNRLINDLRELAQAEAGQLGLQQRPTDLTPLLQRSVALFHELAAEQGVTLAVQLPDDLPPALVDPDRVGQVLHNLLANALRHTPAGGSITLRATTGDDHHQQLSMADSQTSVVIEVVDTGAGSCPTTCRMCSSASGGPTARARGPGVVPGLGLPSPGRLLRRTAGGSARGALLVKAVVSSSRCQSHRMPTQLRRFKKYMHDDHGSHKRYDSAFVYAFNKEIITNGTHFFPVLHCSTRMLNIRTARCRNVSNTHAARRNTTIIEQFCILRQPAQPAAVVQKSSLHTSRLMWNHCSSG